MPGMYVEHDFERMEEDRKARDELLQYARIIAIKGKFNMRYEYDWLRRGVKRWYCWNLCIQYEPEEMEQILKEAQEAGQRIEIEDYRYEGER